jgi:nucleotide-binding universal stress UspA family protein
MKKIIVATDGTPGTEKALERAAASVKGESGEVLVVYAMEDLCPVALDEVDCQTFASIMDKEAQTVIDTSVKKLESLGVSGKGIIIRGEPVEVIVAVAKKEQADEIIAYSLGKKGLVKLLRGSVTAKLVGDAPCPVVIMKNGEHPA